MRQESENLIKLNLNEIDEISAEKLGLRLDHEDERRSIYIIEDVGRFLTESQLYGGIGFSFNKIKQLFEEYPEGLKQLFVIKTDKEIELGRHFHTSTETDGTGKEIFLFVDVPAETKIKAEHYKIDQAKGMISYDIKSGDKVVNDPYEYHVFNCKGPFSMIQLTEASAFKEEDLHKFNPQDWSKETVG